MTPSGSHGATIGQLAAEWRERLRRGERPEMDDYLHRYPQLADEIRELFPAVVLMEDLKDDAGARTGSIAADAFAVEGRKLERLGDYRILREIGRGGMGVVYEAEQESLGRRVALKVLPLQALLDPRYRQRFQREAKAAAKLHHTNIVPVFGVGEQEGTCSYVMQFIAGMGLEKVLAELKRHRQASGVASAPRAPAMPPTQSYHAATGLSAMDVARSLMIGSQSEDATVSERNVETSLPDGRGSVLLSESGSHYWRSVARIGIQVAEALDYAASQGILHRDIKPSNLLLDTRGNVWMTDFGLAKAGAEENLTHTGDVIGTLRYMAPERFEGRSDLRGDLYSLGLTLYELMTLQPAFGDEDRSALIRMVTTTEPPSPRRIDARIPRDLETIVLKAIARDPAHRYQTGAELAEDLQRFVEDRPIRARRVSVRERLWRWCHRNPSLASALAAAALLLIVLAAGSTVAAMLFKQQEREQRHLAIKNAMLAEERSRLAEEKEIERAGAVDAKNDAFASRKLAEERGRELRRNLYFSEMNRAGQAVQSPGGLQRTQEIISRWAVELPDLRGWEWYYLNGLCHREVRTLPGHAGGSRVACWSPDGKWLASCGYDNTIKLWDAADGRIRRTLYGHRGIVPWVAWSPDGKSLASAGYDKTIRLWDVATSGQKSSIRGHTDKVTMVAWSPDGSLLASASMDHTVRLWEASSGKMLRILAGHGNTVTCVSFSPDGKHLASGALDQTVRIWDVAGGKQVRTLEGVAANVQQVVWSPDGRQLAAACRDYTVRIWDAAEGKLRLTLRGHTAWWVWGVAWSPDGTRLASTGTWDGTIRLWDAGSGAEQLVLRGHTGHVWGVAWSPDGKRLSSTSWDGTICIWDVARNQDPLAFPDATAKIQSLAWSLRGQRLLLANEEGSVSILDRDASKPRPVVSGGPSKAPYLAASFHQHQAEDTRLGKTFGAQIVPSKSRSRSAKQGLLSLSTERRLTPEEAMRIEHCQKQGRIFYERLLALEPNNWEYVNRFADFLLDKARLWTDLRRGNVLEPLEMKSEGGATLKRLSDGSIRVGGKNPDRNVYTIRTRAHLEGAQILRLEVLPDPSLPASGPGRVRHGNFILTELAAETAGKSIPLRALIASYAQPGWPLSAAVDGQPETGWAIAPEMGRPNTALFLLETPSGLKATGELTLHLRCQNHAWAKHTLGRFRLFLTSPLEPDTPESLEVWLPVVELAPNGYEGLGVAHALSGQWKAASDAMRTAIAHDEGDRGRHELLLALALQRQDRKNEARHSLDRAIAWLKNHEFNEDIRPSAARALREIGSRNESEVKQTLDDIARWGKYRALSQAIETNPQKGGFYQARAEWSARQGNWRAAADDLAKAHALDAARRAWSAQLAELLLLAEDRDSYNKLCQQTTKELAKELDKVPFRPLIANDMAWLFCLAANAASDYKKLVLLAERAVKEAPTHRARNIYLNTLGAILYRAGRYQEAIDRLNDRLKAIKSDGLPHDWIFLAMAHHHLGNAAEARRWLAKLQGYKPAANASSADFWNDLEIPLLRREVEELLSKPSPRSPSGRG